MTTAFFLADLGISNSTPVNLSAWLFWSLADVTAESPAKGARPPTAGKRPPRTSGVGRPASGLNIQPRLLPIAELTSVVADLFKPDSLPEFREKVVVGVGQRGCEVEPHTLEIESDPPATSSSFKAARAIATLMVEHGWNPDPNAAL